MNRIPAILAALLAILALSVPSLAAGARGVAAHPAPLILLQASGSYAKAPCPLGGLARTMLCQTDGVVLPQAAPMTLVAAAARHGLADETVPGGIASVPRLPPPKRA